MTDEQRREYQREWRAKNRDKLRDQRREYLQRKAIADLASVEQLNGGVAIMRTYGGRTYVVGGRR